MGVLRSRGESGAVASLNSQLPTPHSQAVLFGPVFLISNDRGEDSDQFVAFGDYRVLSRSEHSSGSHKAHPPATLLHLAERDFLLGQRVAITGSVIRLFVVGACGRASSKNLVRNCNANRPSSVQKLHYSDREQPELEETFPQIERFVGVPRREGHTVSNGSAAYLIRDPRRVALQVRTSCWELGVGSWEFRLMNSSRF